MIATKTWLRHMLEPAATSPWDSFKWHDKRSKIKQVANGFKIAAGWIAGFLVMVAVFGGLVRVSEHHSGQGIRAVGVSWLALLVAAVVMITTANRWAPWVTGFFFGPGVGKLLIALAIEDSSYYSAHSITRLRVAEFLLYALVVIILTERF
ncbi:MAG TPA: hypothetical protein VMH05_25935, partial [Bryobacteraceae bacterium]|nr:hypothetical protein [Bryobacteraceae bacterium]